MYTEDEVRDKDCCNSVKNYPDNRRCVAKKCMAWRWALDFNAPLDDPALPIGANYKKSTTHGYCGLAGKP